MLKLSQMLIFMNSNNKSTILYQIYSSIFIQKGTVEAALMPFERIQTLLADSHYHTRFKNTSQAFHYVCMNYGYRELYRGLTPILLRNGPSNVLFFIIREEAAERLPKHV